MVGQVKEIESPLITLDIHEVVEFVKCAVTAPGYVGWSLKAQRLNPARVRCLSGLQFAVKRCGELG